MLPIRPKAVQFRTLSPCTLWVGANLLKLMFCTCWGCQCTVKRVNHKASRPSDSWILNAKTVMASSQCNFASSRSYDAHPLRSVYIEEHGGRFVATNQADQRPPSLDIQAWPQVFWGSIVWQNWVSLYLSTIVPNNHQIIIKQSSNNHWVYLIKYFEKHEWGIHIFISWFD